MQQIAQWYQDSSPDGLVVAPICAEHPGDAACGRDKKIFVTSWTHLMTCSTFDEGAFNRFRDDYRGPTGDAPEKFPLNALDAGRAMRIFSRPPLDLL